MPFWHKAADPPIGASRPLPAPVVLDNGVPATGEVFYNGEWVAATRQGGDWQPILNYDGAPGPVAEDGPAWFYRLGEGE